MGQLHVTVDLIAIKIHSKHSYTTDTISSFIPVTSFFCYEKPQDYSTYLTTLFHTLCTCLKQSTR